MANDSKGDMNGSKTEWAGTKCLSYLMEYV